VKRCTECHSANVRRSGAHATEGEQHPFHSPYRCGDCNARFWVISRKIRLGAAAGGALVATFVALALVPLMMHRQEGPSLQPPGSVSGLREDSTFRIPSPSLDETIATQNALRPLADPLAGTPAAATASAVR
jgi:hypothetical protein